MKRNLSKVLTLILALAMVLGVMTMGASAAFKDDAEITYKEAVDLLTGLGVINGYPDGSFAPKANFDRGGLAKMVAYFAWGGKDLSNYYKGSNVFTDLKGYEWAAGCINYGYNAGYIAGVGDGKSYNPAGTVKGSELAKTLLVVLGYNPKTSNVLYALEGANWELNSIRIAQQVGLFEGIGDFDPTAALSREQAAQIFMNALFLNTVSDLKDDGSPKAIAGDDIATSIYKLDSVSGILSENQATGNAKTVVGANQLDYATSLELIGHQVKFYYKDTGTTGFQTTDKVYAVLDKTAEVVVAGTETAAALKANLNAAGITTDLSQNSVNQVQNGAIVATTNAELKLGTTTGAAFGASTILIADNAIIGVKLADAVYTDKVTAVSTTSGSEVITLSYAGALQNNATSDVVNEYTGIAVDDYVTYVKAGSIYNLTKATTVEGKITKNAGGTLTVNGTAYKKYDTNNNAGIGFDAVDYSKTYVLTLTPAGEYFGLKVKTGEGVADAGLLYVVKKFERESQSEYGVKVPTYYIQGVDSSAKEVIYQVTKTEYGTVNEKTLNTVTTSYDSALKATVADLTAVSENTTVGTAELNSATVAANAVKIADKYYYASDVQFIYVSGSAEDLKVEAKSGVQALNTANGVYYGVKDAAATNYSVKYVFVDGVAGTAATGTGVMAGFEASASTTTVPYTMANGKIGTAYVHTVYIDGVKTEINMANDTAISGFFHYTVDSTTGLYATNGAYASENVKAGKITNNYNGIISCSGTFEDINVTGAKLVNVVAATDANYAKIATSAAALTTHETVSIVLDGDSNAVVVYITAYTA